MNYLTLEEILFIHFYVITDIAEEFSYSSLLNPDHLLASVARPQQNAFENEVHPDVFRKATALAQSLILGHPFFDGNKRIGIAAGCVFLAMNGYKIDADDDSIVTAAMQTASGAWDYEDLHSWFQKSVSQP